MAKKPDRLKGKRRRRAPLENRFEIPNDPVTIGDRKALRSAQFEVVDRLTGLERALKVWRKTGAEVDDDLRQLWLHEMRQVQRIMSYAGAREVIVDILEFVEDDEEFGVLLETAGTPLSSSMQRVSRQHWIRNLGAARSRALFWANMRRIVDALGIVHAQGLVHGRISTDAIMTEAGDDPDFQLTGFEWSLWVTADRSERIQAKLGAGGAAIRAIRYSFEEDWKALGKTIASCLDAVVRPSGDVQPLGRAENPIELSLAERSLIKRLVAPARFDNLDAAAIGIAIDDLVVEVRRPGSARTGTFILMFAQASGLADAIYDLSEGEIPLDDYPEQLGWVRADLDRGATLLSPPDLDPVRGKLQLVTSLMLLNLEPLRQDGARTWDVAVCSRVQARPDALRLGGAEEHDVVQPIEVTTGARHAIAMRAKLGPESLDWSGFAGGRQKAPGTEQVDLIRQSLLLIQIIEAVIKALDIYPIDIMVQETTNSRRRVVVRAQPDNERDRIAAKLGLQDTERSLKRLFEDDQRDAGSKWRISQAATLGASRSTDVAVSFVDLRESRGRQGYAFELDEPLPTNGPFFLRTEREAGTEGAITRRLRNIKALGTRIDLVEMLADPWRVRRSSRDILDEAAQADEYYQDLDIPKREALKALWSTVPSFSVVGPPGVGKTRLATESVRRRFAADRATRMLLTAQGHDALDHLEDEVGATLRSNGMEDVIVVRSTTSDRRTRSDRDLHTKGMDVLRGLSESALAADAPEPLRDRVIALLNAGQRLNRSKDSVDRDERVALNAVSSLILDGANVVVSTLNSPDIERLVEAREQFDWVVVEEAAKATGPELIGSLMLSGRRLLIGDHNQLPPFDADRLVKVLQNHDLVGKAIGMAEQFVGPLMRDGEVAELLEISRDAHRLSTVTDYAFRLFEPFRHIVTEDHRRAQANPGHRAISGVLTEQRRMDPAIAEIVSEAFYDGSLRTQEQRAKASLDAPPFDVLAPLPASPIVVVDFRHVSKTGVASPMERARPRWHNPGEIEAVLAALRHVRAHEGAKRPSLAILSFYNAQVDKLGERIDGEVRAGRLPHLAGFRPAVAGEKWVSTVDGFQGNEADLVLISLVRNNSGTGMRALGFLRDKRRWNVALSRAKSKLIIVGSTAFLREAVVGVNPDALTHDLSFLTVVTDALHRLASERRTDGLPRAEFIDPVVLTGASGC